MTMNQVCSPSIYTVNFGKQALEEHIDAIPLDDKIDNADANSNSLEQAEKGEESTQDNTEHVDVEESETTGPDIDGGEESDDIDHCVWKFGDNDRRDKFLVDLYLLADKLLDPVTANMAIDKLIRMSEARERCPSQILVCYVYRSTAVESPLRRLFRDWYVFTVSESWVDTIHRDGYPHAFLKDLIYEIYNLQRDNQRKRIRKVFSP